MKKTFLAFTLAEVLVTLGIIGIVAAMTIPTLQANFQKQEYVTSLKKAYTSLNQAFMQMSADMGCPGDLVCTGLLSSSVTVQDFGEELSKYFKLVVKNCETTSTGCFSSSIAYNYDGTGSRSAILDYVDRYRFITADGMAFFVVKTTCSNYSRGVTNHLTQSCGIIIVDVNGPVKGPNNVGRDIFYFRISNGKGPIVYPFGGIDDDETKAGNNGGGWWKDPSSQTPRHCIPSEPTGRFCTARIIEEGWQMNY